MSICVRFFINHVSVHGKTHGVVKFLLFIKMKIKFKKFFDDAMLFNIRFVFIITTNGIKHPSENLRLIITQFVLFTLQQNNSDITKEGKS